VRGVDNDGGDTQHSFAILRPLYCCADTSESSKSATVCNWGIGRPHQGYGQWKGQGASPGEPPAGHSSERKAIGCRHGPPQHLRKSILAWRQHTGRCTFVVLTGKANSTYFHCSHSGMVYAPKKNVDYEQCAHHQLGTAAWATYHLLASFAKAVNKHCNRSQMSCNRKGRCNCIGECQQQSAISEGGGVTFHD